MQLIDEKNHVLHLADLVHDGLDALLELAAVFRAGNHKGEVEGDDFLIAEDFRHIAGSDFLSESFDDGGFTDTRLPDENRVVFRPTAEDLDHTLDLAFTADHRVETAFASDFGEVAAECLERGSFRFPFTFRAWSLGLAVVLEWTVAVFDILIVVVIIVLIVRRKVRIDFREDFVAGALDIDVQTLQHAGGHAFAFAEEAEKQMLGADIRMVEGLGFLVSKGKDFFHAGRVRNVSRSLLWRAGSYFLLDLHADGFEFQAHAFQHVDGHALAELDEAEQQMLGTYIGMVESVCFLSGKSEDLLSAWGEVVHASPGLGESEGFFSSFVEIRISGESSECKRERTISARIESLSSGDSFLPE